MSTLLAWIVAIYVLYLLTGKGSRFPGSNRKIFRLSHHETIRFVDGPLEGTTAQQRTDRAGLPAFQITPRVTRRGDLGGSYTLPYERRLLCDDCHHWHYTEGWTDEDLALADITEWGKAA